ncbi:MAG TPA: GntR family transcriptional regulator, partial [Steroidobacteraceae bacterium]|nr:GntR family transcriptional regulator [Steroidobacteraceae bacterium]
MTLQPASTTRYQQVKHFILDRIAGGSLRAGERVPSENELTRTLTVSRMTANRALRELAEDGVLVRVAGVGTF